jgi:hypothetical protein
MNNSATAYTQLRVDEQGQAYMAQEQYDALMLRLDKMNFWAEFGFAFQVLNRAMTDNPEAEVVMKNGRIILNGGNAVIGTAGVELITEDLLRAAQWLSRG